MCIADLEVDGRRTRLKCRDQQADNKIAWRFRPLEGIRLDKPNYPWGIFEVDETAWIVMLDIIYSQLPYNSIEEIYRNMELLEAVTDQPELIDMATANL